MSKNERLIQLIKRAIGDRTQQTFATVAGISQYNLSRIMHGNTKGNIQKSTLKRIADASEGRVSESELQMACGYIKIDNETLDDTTAPLKAKLIAELLADKATAYIGHMVYPDIKHFVLQVLAEVGISESFLTSIQILDDRECSTVHPNNAEREAIIRISTIKCGYDMKFPCIIYYVQTTKGNVVPLSYDSSLTGLLRMSGLDMLHPDAQQVLIQLSTTGDVILTDHPYVYSCTPHIATSDEEKLGLAIFGND